MDARYVVRPTGDESARYFVLDLALGKDAGRDQYSTWDLAAAEARRLDQAYGDLCDLLG